MAAPLPLEGELYRYTYGGKGPPCGDPRARTGEDQCLPTITLARFSRSLTQQEVDAIRQKLGGPVIYVPAPSPPGPGPEPGPE